jgi:hypothetical protein
MDTNRDKIMYQCELCSSQFQFGPHRYAGKFIARYQIMVCSMCYDGNWDGWGPMREARLLTHLEDKGLPVPQRNENGWLPRD